MRKRFRTFWVMLWENITMSLENIRGNKGRSFLTILGILIGVAAVIALISTVNGVTGSLTSSLSSLGAGSVTVSVTGSDLKAGMNADDLNELAQIEGVAGIVPSVSSSKAVVYGGQRETKISVAGKSAYYFRRNPDLVTRGRALNITDEDNETFVCLISAEMVETFFFGIDPIGQTMYISGLPFTVVGLFEEDSGSMASLLTGSPDILLPWTTALKITNDNLVTSFTVYAKDGMTSDLMKERLTATMDPMFSYEEDVYTITTMDALEETMATMTGMMSALLAGIASISLVVGGIGIMNMMLTTVTERTMEIGLKKALGAKPRQIQAQFLIESFILSVLGGIAGVIVGLTLSFALSKVLTTTFSVSIGSIALGVGFSAAVGIIFGWTPARKASKLNPIDALRAM